ncbi:MAG: NAD(P)-dependent oxidoreductase [Chloroflexota bacterium]|nr:MAG: NAD(P)-dependent oxidoreductase [Chloroflexota bacterium]
MQITITGGTGSLSEYIQNSLAGTHELVLFDRVQPAQNRFQYELKGRLVTGDLTSFEDCERAVAGSQAIIHLGAIPWPVEHPVWRERIPGAKNMPWDETFRVNTMGTYYLLEAAKRAGVKVVVAATSNCVLGHGFRISDRPFPVSYLPIDEEHPLDFEDSYSLSKHVKEDIMAAYSRSYGLRCYGIRPATIMRPEMQRQRAEKFAPATEWSEWFFGYNDIRDIARAFTLCLDAGAAEQLPMYDNYFINAADTLEVENTRDLVARLRPELLPKLRDITGRQAFISTAKAEKAFGWKSQYSWTQYLPVGVK